MRDRTANYNDEDATVRTDFHFPRDRPRLAEPVDRFLGVLV